MEWLSRWFILVALVLSVPSLYAQVGITRVRPSNPGKGAEPSIGENTAPNTPSVVPGPQGNGVVTGNGIEYHGGNVIANPNVYFIWYGNWNGNPALNVLPRYISDLSGSVYSNINTTYSDNAGQTVPSRVNMAWQAYDNYSHGAALSDAAIQGVVSTAITGGALPKDTNGVYFVLTSADVTETSGFCTAFCGFHTHASISGSDIKFAFVGNPDRCPGACEVQSTGPNGTGGADGMANVITHEFNEAVTDPDLNAWFHNNLSGEDGDLCNFNFGSGVFTAPNGTSANISLSGRQYLIQQNWVNAQNWAATANGSCVMSQQGLVGIGLDQQLYTRATRSSGWVQVPNSGWVIGVTTLQDGTIVGVGTDNVLYTRATLNSGWVQVPNSGWVIGITALQDGTIVGVGTDNLLYTRATLYSGWVQVPGGGCCVIGVTARQDGSIVGIGTDNLLYTRATLNSGWVRVPDSGSVIGITVAPTTQPGKLVGVGTDEQLWTRSTLNSEWVQVPNSGWVTGITVLRGGTIVGVGTDNLLYTRATLNSGWAQVPNSGWVLGITALQDGTIVGVGTDNLLYTRATLNSGWVQVPDRGCCVIGITALQDGSIVGIGTDNLLYSRATVNSGWVQVPDGGCCVIGITARQDGSMVGIGTDNQLYTRATLNSGWVQVPNSGAVIGIAVTPRP